MTRTEIFREYLKENKTTVFKSSYEDEISWLYKKLIQARKESQELKTKLT